MASKPKAPAETEDDEAEGEAPAKKRRFALPSRKYLIIGGIALLALAGGGGGAYFTLFKGKAEAKGAPPQAKWLQARVDRGLVAMSAHACPLQPGSLLHSHLWQQVRGAVVTSASRRSTFTTSS